MKGTTRAQRKAIQLDPQVIGEISAARGAWYETERDIEKGLAWGKRKAALLAWLRLQMGRRLTLRERRCIELYFLEDLTYLEVGAREHCSASTACRSVARAVKKLRAAANEDDSWKRFVRRRR